MNIGNDESRSFLNTDDPWHNECWPHGGACVSSVPPENKTFSEYVHLAACTPSLGSIFTCFYASMVAFAIAGWFLLSSPVNLILTAAAAFAWASVALVWSTCRFVDRVAYKSMSTMYTCASLCTIFISCDYSPYAFVIVALLVAMAVIAKEAVVLHPDVRTSVCAVVIIACVLLDADKIDVPHKLIMVVLLGIPASVKAYMAASRWIILANDHDIRGVHVGDITTSEMSKWAFLSPAWIAEALYIIGVSYTIVYT